jgi:hypothetical protein
LKFGQAEAVAQATLVVTVVHFQLAALEAIMGLRLLQHLQDVSTVYVLVVLGRVVKHILVVQVWVVRVM